MTLQAGTRLGNYEILGKLGEGGMGEVYRARDTRLGRDVALKILSPGFAADPDRLERFEREARAVASLSHPNIVTLFSVEDDAGARFITMELIEGQALDCQIPAAGLPITRVLELGAAMADALAAAHAKRIVHRDFKPANVMLTVDGRVKVLDFGLAKAGTSDITPTDETVLATATSAGQVMGTVPYMAPEQVRGEATDARSDLFALGTVLYELTSGRRPFAGATLGVISSAILRDTPAPLTALRADVPTDLVRIIMRCLEKDPRARFQAAIDIATELRAVRMATESPSLVKNPTVPSTPLLGREDTLALAVARVQSGARVLTISGYGGTGKTRFAIELHRRLAPSFAGGAAFISLASVTAAADVLPTVCSTLGIAEAHGRSALDALATVIGQRPVLLVLDNMEQVLASAGDVAVLVARCPALQIVATSRAPLKISAEIEFSLPPLDVPAAGARSVEAIGSCAAVALFVQRAEKVTSGFALTPDNAEAVAAICRRLDGLPLALELAAARVRILEPAALLQRLDHALDLLTSGDRDLPLRQRTLRATISWSYSLLEPREQTLLRSVSVFHEGWTLEALEQVCYSDEDRPQAIDHLDSLVEKGLVRIADGRYGLLETVRAFAAEQLHAAGAVERMRHAHAAYFLSFAGQISAGIFGTAQLDAMTRARRDNANTLAAAQWLSSCARQNDADALERAMQLCGHLDWFWHITAQHHTGRALLDPLLALADARLPSRGRAYARLTSAMISSVTGEWERSLAEWTGGVSDGEAVGDAVAVAEGKMGIGYCCLSLGRIDDARAALDDAIAHSDRGVSDFMHAISLTLKGMLLFATGQLEDGIATVSRARCIQERLGDREGGGVALSFLAQMYVAKGDHSRSLELYHEALAALTEVGDFPEVARVQCEMGWTALAASQPDAARRAFVRAVHTYEEVGSPRGTGLALLGLAAVDAAEGRSERAVQIAAASEALSKRAGVVVDHPMDPGLASRIEALKASIPKPTLDGLMASASTLSPDAVLAMLT